jgi:hypothetical protein
LKEDDSDWQEASKLDGWNISVKNQCPNSPDTNVCDLGFFRTLQSQQWKLPATKNIDDLIERVQQAFEELALESIDANFLTLQSCLDKIVERHGGNDYNIPHLAKNKLCTQSGGKLPDGLPVSDLAKEVIEELGFELPMPDTI